MRVVVTAIVVVMLFAVAVLAQDGDNSYLPLVQSAATDGPASPAIPQGYVRSCETHHAFTRATVVAGFFEGYDSVVYSTSADGQQLGSALKGDPLMFSTDDAVAGEWWLWLVNSAGERISEPVFLKTDAEPGLGRCQNASVVFYSNAPGEGDPCASIGGDGCKFKPTGGPRFAAHEGDGLKLQFFFIHSGIDGGQPQGSYFIALKKGEQPLPISDSVRSVALQRSEGPAGAYNYEYTVPIEDLA